MSTINRFEEIEAWRSARELTSRVYRATGRGRFSQDFGLRNQIERAAVSVLSNIAEGFESDTPRLFINFLRRAKGSAGEVRSQLYVALDQSYISEAEFKRLSRQAVKVSRQISNLIKYLLGTLKR